MMTSHSGQRSARKAEVAYIHSPPPPKQRIRFFQSTHIPAVSQLMRRRAGVTGCSVSTETVTYFYEDETTHLKIIEITIWPSAIFMSCRNCKDWIRVKMWKSFITIIIGVLSSRCKKTCLFGTLFAVETIIRILNIR